MKTKNILFIVEGKNDEPRCIEQLLSKCYPVSNFKLYSYEANLHMLASRLKMIILILIDYKPKNFFDQITKHETSFKLPYIEQS